AMIENSIGSRMFQHLYIKNKDQSQSKDVVQGGELSCAFFVSNILYFFDLIKTPHATVSSTEKDMKNFGWKEIDELKKGAVIVWEKVKYESGEKHSHLGFYMGYNQAISNSFKKKVPHKHHFTYGEKSEPKHRKIKSILWHPDLN
ncbi:MAG: hypothetical protein K9L95_06375, partial [Candidatus Omnitrophica bacterium]|nr:hypothetical protein [Candidatus Omnitrophota bacterium]